jgi:glyoxylase I family protein
MAVDVESGMPLLAVYDVPTAIAFYRDVLGFEVTQTSPPFDEAPDNYGWAHLRKNGANLMLNNMYEDNLRPEQPDADRSMHHRDTTIYFMCRDVDGV